MRWLVRVTGSLLLLALLAVAALFLVPTEKVAGLAAAEFRKITGRDLQFDGAVHPTVWPHLGVRTGPVTLANAAWSDAGPMLRAEGLSIAVDLAALIGGTVRVTGLEIRAPQLLLERAADGRVNWSFGDEGAAEAGGSGTGTGGAGMPLGIDRARIEGGTITYLDHASGARRVVSDVAFEATVPEFQGAAEVDGSATIGGQRVTLDGTIAAFGPFLDGKVVPAVLTGRIGTSRVGFDGRVGWAPLAAEGALEATLDDLPALFAVLGQPAPDLPEGLGRRLIAVTGAVTLTPEGSVHLRDGTLALDETRLTGALDLVPGKVRPKLTARLTAGALRLAAPGGEGSGGGGAGAPAAAGWSTAPIDASGLGAIDGEVSLAAESVDLGGLALGRTRAVVTLDNARAVINLREVAAYGGSVTGDVILNARKGFSTRVDLSLTGLALEPLMSQMAGYDRLSGTGDLRVNLLGVGGTLDALMRSLAGEGRLALRQGEVRGLDLAGMIRTLDAGYVGESSKTVFDAITGSFTVTQGVLTNTDLALAAPLVTASGAGTVDLGGQTLDYRLIPLSLGGRELDPDVQVPVVIRGPWAAPTVRLDLEALARRRFEAEAKALEERAKAELARKVEQELGIVQQEGESLEDAARRGVEEALQDEATRALQRLLGGD